MHCRFAAVHVFLRSSRRLTRCMYSDVSYYTTPKAFHSNAQGRRYAGAPWVIGPMSNGYAESVTHLASMYSSIPHIPFVNRDAVFLAQSAKLVLECLATMMVLLIGDIFNECIDMRGADRKRSITLLP